MEMRTGEFGPFLYKPTGVWFGRFTASVTVPRDQCHYIEGRPFHSSYMLTEVGEWPSDWYIVRNVSTDYGWTIYFAREADAVHYLFRWNG